MNDKIFSNENKILSENEKEIKIAKLTMLFDQFFEILDFDNKHDSQLMGTSKRMAKMWVNELLEGTYTPQPKITVFPNDREYDQMIITEKIQVSSLCAHHFLPVTGYCTIGYLPDKNIVGLSKFARITEWFARRPQTQEELGQQIANFVYETAKPLGVGVYIEASHSCMTLRGAKQPHDSKMKTLALKGLFLEDPNVKNEFLNFIK